jgi:hypothetical protein
MNQEVDRHAICQFVGVQLPRGSRRNRLGRAHTDVPPPQQKDKQPSIFFLPDRSNRRPDLRLQNTGRLTFIHSSKNMQERRPVMLPRPL